MDTNLFYNYYNTKQWTQTYFTIIITQNNGHKLILHKQSVDICYSFFDELNIFSFIHIELPRLIE